VSGHVDALMAGEDVVEQVLDGGSPFAQNAGAIDLAVLFVSGDHAAEAHAIARLVRRELDPGCLIGATSNGVIGLDRELEDVPGVSLLTISLPGTRLRPFTYADLPHATPADRGSLEALAESIGAGPDLRAVLFFADPFSVATASVVEALSSLPLVEPGLTSCPVIGGICSTPGGPGANAVMLNGAASRSGAVGLTISGDVAVDSVVSQGCRPIGEPLVVTSAKRNVLMQLGGRKAIDVVRDIVNELPEDERTLLSAGLYVGRVVNEYKPRFGRGDFLIRNVLGVDQASGSVAVNDQLRVGQTVQFHLRDAHTAAEDLELLLQSEIVKPPAGAAILCNCNARGRALFNAPDADADAVTRWLGNRAGVEPSRFPLAGLFAGGEIGPIGGRSYVHGHTASLALFRKPV
jgi:small ligand-binding sensory domain FIST